MTTNTASDESTTTESDETHEPGRIKRTLSGTAHAVVSCGSAVSNTTVRSTKAVVKGVKATPHGVVKAGRVVKVSPTLTKVYLDDAKTRRIGKRQLHREAGRKARNARAKSTKA